MLNLLQTRPLRLLAAGLLAAAAGGPASGRELSTDRPDQTESPHTVEAGRFQVEMDVVHFTSDCDRSGGGDVRTRIWSVAPVNLKLGLSAGTDLQLMIDPWVRVRTEDRRAGTTATDSGFGDVTTRLKVNLWGNDGGPTAAAVMPFVKWPLSASAIRNGETEGGLIFILGFGLPAGWGAAAMTEVDFVAAAGGGRAVEWLNTITVARDLTDRLGCYFEFAALTGDEPGFRWRGQFDCGLTYALGPDLQLDVGCNFGVTRSAPDYQPFLGISRRF